MDHSNQENQHVAPQNLVDHSFLHQLEQVNFQEVFHSLWLNRQLIGLFMLIGFCFSAMYFTLHTPIYTSSAILQIEDQDGSLLGLGKLGTLVGGGGGGTAKAVDVQTALIKSRYILKPVVEQLGLDLSIQPDYFPGFGALYAHYHQGSLTAPLFGLSHFAWGGESLKISTFEVPYFQQNKRFTLVVLPKHAYALYDDQGAKILTGQVGQLVTVNRPEGTYSLEVTDLIANSGAHFYVVKKETQAIVNGLVQNIQIADIATANHIEGILGETGVLKLSLDGPDPKFLVSVLNTIAQVDVQKNMQKKSMESNQSIKFLNEELPKVKEDLDQTGEQLNNYLASHKMVDLTTQSKLILGELVQSEKNLELLKMQKAEALQDYTPEHPFVKNINEQEKVLTTEITSLENQASQLPMHDQEVIKLTRDLRVKSQLYLILLGRLQSLQINKAGTVSDVQILDDAQVPLNPIPLSVFLVLLAGVLIGGAFGGFFVIIRNLFHQKISDPLAVEKKFGIANLAIIPYSGKQHELFLQHKPRGQVVPLLAQADPKDLSIEALRSLRTSLQFSMLEARNNVITIIGVAPGIGKSFVSANFAYLLADAGKRILLIDADIRKGHLSDYFKVGKLKGLTEIICKTASFEEVKITGGNQNLDFIPAGAYPPNPSELLMSASFKHFLETISPAYDMVIIDTAPILAVTDPAIIAQHAGANFIVLGSDMHDVAEVEIALKRFAANKVHINGMIFNFSQPQKGLYKRTHAHKYEKYQYKYESPEE